MGRALVRLLISASRYDEASDLALELLNMVPEDDDTVETVIKALSAKKSYQRMFNIVQDLHKEESISRDTTRFEQLLLFTVDGIGPMLKTNDAIDWFMPIADKVIRLSWERQLYGSYTNIIMLKQKHFISSDDAEEDWKQTLRASNEESDQSIRASIEDFASLQLSLIYLDKAISADTAGEDYSEWSEKLKLLALHEVRKFKGQQVYRATPSSVMYGHWLLKFEKADAVTWMECFRASVLTQLDMLDDDIPSNDQDAIARLGIILLLAGDIDNAAAALAVASRSLEIVALEPSRSFELNRMDNLKIKWTCDGECRTPKSQFKELHFCEECYDTGFCENCIVLVKEGRLPFRRCSAAHSFVRMYPAPPEARDVAARFVGPEMRLEVQKDWLASMRRKWVD